jgi:hypothetical protein
VDFAHLKRNGIVGFSMMSECVVSRIDFAKSRAFPVFWGVMCWLGHNELLGIVLHEVKGREK